MRGTRLFYNKKQGSKCLVIVFFSKEKKCNFYILRRKIKLHSSSSSEHIDKTFLKYSFHNVQYRTAYHLPSS